ncbi:hypothetical protein V2J09_021054 [Rumex salicifolius]
MNDWTLLRSVFEPTLAQLVERRTVVGVISCREILRSLVRIRQVGSYFCLLSC